MKQRLLLTAAFAGILGVGLLSGGCNNDKDATVPVKTAAQVQAETKNKKQGGGMDDMTVIPAPAGMQTGVAGGKK